MIVLSLTNCPQALRGDLTRWLLEISTGVYVGNISSRVRDELWRRITANVKSGRVVMVFSAKNEQRMDFRVHNSSWEPIDFDGLKLMLRPSEKRLQSKREQQELNAGAPKHGYSKASKMLAAKRYGGRG
ncbi:MAG: type I-E CRISPR-associated endoribonuclease Cas2e [Clostridia bacterium]|nr:type I-E CRISPR-associated endoribonuclease Cas2e [Clostridia bacterium]